MADVPITGSGVKGKLNIVLANGCFDILHAGHIEHLREARSMGDFLFVGLTDDKFVNKPGRPVLNWEDRASVLRELRCVTAVVRCESGVEAILDVNPQIFVKGLDYEGIGITEEEKKALESIGAEVRYTQTSKRSTTEIIAKIIHEDSERKKTMWQRTRTSLPFTGEVLAVVHFIDDNKEQTHDDAVWNGEEWTRRNDGMKFEKDYYSLWRRLET